MRVRSLALLLAAGVTLVATAVAAPPAAAAPPDRWGFAAVWNPTVPAGTFITYHRQRAVFGAVDVPKYFGYIWTGGGGQTNYNHQLGFGANAVGMLGTGLYQVKYPQLGVRETHAQVTAYGEGPNYCGLGQPWTYSGPDGLVTVICFDTAGNPANHRFLSTFTSRH